MCHFCTGWVKSVWYVYENVYDNFLYRKWYLVQAGEYSVSEMNSVLYSACFWFILVIFTKVFIFIYLFIFWQLSYSFCRKIDSHAWILCSAVTVPGEGKRGTFASSKNIVLLLQFAPNFEWIQSGKNWWLFEGLVPWKKSCPRPLLPQIWCWRYHWCSMVQTSKICNPSCTPS